MTIVQKALATLFRKSLWKVGSFLIVALAITLPLHADEPDSGSTQVIFPGQADPQVSAAIMKAYELALLRNYDAAREICLELGRDFPGNPAGPTGEMVLYQVMMLENEDYNYDAEFRAAARRAEAAAAVYAETAPKNDWYYTLLGASWGIEGVYFLRRAEFFSGLYYGLKGFNYMIIAERMSEKNYEARLAIGLFLYYRSAMAGLLPTPWEDQREQGLAMLKEAGDNRAYLKEVSRIALFIINLNEENDPRQAFEYVNELIEQRPNFPLFYHFGGQAMMDQKKYEPAYDYYLRMSEIAPELYLPYFKLGECALEMGDKEKARDWFNRFFETLGDQQSDHRKPAQKYLRELSE